MKYVPAEPMKTRAGWKFHGRKPASAPARQAHSRATAGWSMADPREIRPSVTAAIRATPVESPSSPSIQLMLLIMPAIQKTVNPTANGVENGMTPPPAGL